MKLKLNVDLMKYKKGLTIDFDKLTYTESVFFKKRIKDSKIDNCVELVTEKDFENPIEKAKSKGIDKPASEKKYKK